jgi:hypothetical protein
MSSSVIFYLQSAIGLAICLFALWKGGGPERYGAGLIVGVVILQRIVAALAPPSAFPIIQLVGDALTAVGLLVIALAYASLWIGGAMLLYAAQFTLHSFYFVTERPNDRFHAVANNLDFIGIILCLAIGTLVAWRQRVVAIRRARTANAVAAAPPA